MADNRKNKLRNIIGIDGGHREYNINGITYIASSRFAKPTFTNEDKTLVNLVEEYVGSEFADLTENTDESIIKRKPRAFDCRKGEIK